MLRLGLEIIAKVPSHMDKTLEEHKEIVNALEKGSFEEAKEALTQHLSNTKCAIIGNLPNILFVGP